MTNEQKAKDALERFKALPDDGNEDISGFEEGYLWCLNDNPVLGNLLQITWLSANHLSLDHYRYLEAVAKEEEVGSNKWMRHLEKHGFVFNHEITERGKEILSIVPHLKGNAPLTKEKKVKKEYHPDFKKWLEAFPKSDNFEYQGRKFTGTRNLHSKLPESETLFLNILKEGKYSLDDMLKALHIELAIRRQKSFEKGTNEFSFMSGTSPYLNQRKFEIYINQTLPSQPKRNSFNVSI